MEIIESATEQTTAATNVLVAIVMIAVTIIFIRLRGKDRYKANIWTFASILVFISVFLGAIVHGIKMSDELNFRIWQIIYLSLGLMIALFVVASIYDIWGQHIAQKSLPIMLAVGFAFFGVTLIWPDTFLVFIMYQAVAMLFALSGYIWLASGKRLDGAWIVASGILVSIIASVVQATKFISFTLIWQFDHNGAYHLVQLLGLVLLTAGIRKALLAVE